SWEQLSERVHMASLSLESEAHRVSFLYICADSEVPAHVLSKNEFTMILAGSLHDNHGQYLAGDFIVTAPDNHRSPSTGSNESCLCLSGLSEPLRLNSRLAQQPLRYLDPLRRGAEKTVGSIERVTKCAGPGGVLAWAKAWRDSVFG